MKNLQQEDTQIITQRSSNKYIEPPQSLKNTLDQEETYMPKLKKF